MATMTNSSEMNVLNKIDYTKVDYESIVADITSILQTYPQYKNDWQDFLSSNAGRMLLETFSYIASKIIMRADLIANEMFLPTAEDPQAIVNILKLIGYSLTPPSESMVELTVQTTDGSLVNNDEIPLKTLLNAKDLSDQDIVFEIMNDKFDYYNTIKFNNETSKTIKAYSGKTVESVVLVSSKENFSYTFEEYPAISGSLKIYLGTYDTPLEEITSLVLSDKDSLGRPRYTLTYDSLFRPTITFGKENFGGAFSNVIDGVPETYEELRVFFRVGGGKNSNITSSSLNGNFIQTTGGINLEVSNEKGAVGGNDGQNVYDAQKFAPLIVKTVNKTVTPEDYNTLLLNQNLITIEDVATETPYENPEIAPYLFTYLYISPQRNWSDFALETDDMSRDEKAYTIPSIITNESVEGYNERFLIRLNNFLNLRGFSELGIVYRDVANDIDEYGISNDFLIYPSNDKNSDNTYSEEAYVLYYDFLLDKKITGIENIFRKINYVPFKVDITVFYKQGFNGVDLKKSIDESLRSFFSKELSKISGNIKISNIYEQVQSFNGVSYSKINYPTEDIVVPSDSVYFILPSSVISSLPSQSATEFDLNINMLKE
jgi:hypothetical protein